MEKARQLRVLFIPTSSSGIQWWRIQSWVQSAWKQGLASFQNPLWMKEHDGIQEWQSRLTDTAEKSYDPIFVRQFIPMIESGCQQADAVVFQYAHEEGALELFEAIKIKYPHLPILTEIDDNVLSVPTYNEAFQTYDPRSAVRKRAIAQMRQSDGIIVSTPYLKEVFSEFNKNIWVVENSIDFKVWDRIKKGNKPGVRIGWAGGSGHEGDFEPYAEGIKRILAKHKNARLVLLNGPAKTGIPEFFKGVERVEHKAVWVPILKYPKLIMSEDFDIGIAPLVDSAFNRGKSNLKWLENSAMGIPTIASNVGHMAETIHTGRDGILCDDASDFELALHVLISDRKRRIAMGRAANERARKDFDVNKNVHHYISCLKEAISIKHRESDAIAVAGEA